MEHNLLQLIPLSYYTILYHITRESREEEWGKGGGKSAQRVGEAGVEEESQKKRTLGGSLEKGGGKCWQNLLECRVVICEISFSFLFRRLEKVGREGRYTYIESVHINSFFLCVRHLIVCLKL